MGLIPPNIIRPPSDNTSLNRELNPNLDITICNEKPLSVLWHEFEINVGRFLLSIWRELSFSARVDEAWKRSRNVEIRIPSYGVTAQEASDTLCKMTNALPRMRDYLPEQCSFTQYNDAGFAFTSADGRG